MSYKNQNIELRTRFDSVWANRIPVDWPNLKFTYPDPISTWCRFRVSGGGAHRTTIGDTLNNERITGIVFIQLFTPIETGDAVIMQLADEAAEIFRDWCGTNVMCRTPMVRPIGPDGLGYYQVNVSIPFVRNELV